MKKLYKIFVSLIAITGVCSASLKAQQGICLPPEINKSFEEKFLQARKNNFANLTLANKHQLRVFFHIVTNDNGSKPGAILDSITTELADMQSDFASGNICFVYAGLNYIANTTLNHINLDTNDDAEDLFAAHVIPGCINIFYVFEIKGKNANSGGGIGGVAFHSPSTFNLVAKYNLGTHTSSHETGHCLGLKHTYGSSGDDEEYISGKECDDRGDNMCDTKADPYYHALENCFHTDGGKYDGNCHDPAGATNFSPPYNNIMSYWSGSNQIFTSDQFDKMHYTIDDDDDVKTTASYSDFIMTPYQYNNGYVYISAINSLSVIGTEFTGLVTGGLYGKTVTLSAGFHAQPITSSVTIKATDCNTAGFAPVARTATSSLREIKTGNKTIKDSLNNSLVIYPNPSTNYFNVQYKQAKAFSALINVRNVNGQIVFTSTKNNVLNLRERVTLGNKAKGVYFIELYVNGRRLTAKTVMQ